jgi:primase-polymerase (primpol)-like protein
MGYMLSSKSALVGIDWDNVRDPHVGDSSVPEFVLDWIRDIEGCVSVSVSGTGLHQWCLASKGAQEALAERKNIANLPIESLDGLDEQPKMEVYQQERYITVTGAVWSDPRPCQTYTDLKCNNAPLRELIEELLSSSSYKKGSIEPSEDVNEGPQSLTAISDQNGQRHAHRYSDGKWVETENPTVKQIRETGFVQSDEFRRLWNGQESGYKSTSEADHIFISKLWFYAGSRDGVWNCLRASNRHRKKWERDDYLTRSIEKTRDNDRYDGDYFSPEE